MGKIKNDKYYTSVELARYCIDKTYEVVGRENITEIIEPSAGSGSFSLQIPDCIAYDIEPEHETIIKQDYLELDEPYREGRLVIGNPPFGSRNTLSVQFFKRSIKIADYVAFILPISQHKNVQQMYEFDLIHSEDLGLHTYTDRELHCCFNIYRRPRGDKLNKRPNYRLEDVEVREYRRSGTYKKPEHYDFGMCTWGGSCGKEVEYVGQYAQEAYVIVKNEELRGEILRVCRETDWRNLYPSISSAKLQMWKIYKHFGDMVPNIK